MKKALIYILQVIIAFKGYIFREWIMYFPSHRVRLFFIKRTLAHVGAGTNFMLGVEIRNGKNISVGDNCVINKRVLLDGRGGKLTIGDNVDIAQETNIWTLEHDVHDDYHTAKGDNITIEDYVWIASRATVLPGVTIGRGAVIASSSIVTKSVEALAIAGGIPAKKIGVRRSKLLYKLHYKPKFG